MTDANALRPAGCDVDRAGLGDGERGAGAGRVLLGNVEVRTDTNVLVGAAT